MKQPDREEISSPSRAALIRYGNGVAIQYGHGYPDITVHSFIPGGESYGKWKGCPDPAPRGPIPMKISFHSPRKSLFCIPLSGSGGALLQCC